MNTQILSLIQRTCIDLLFPSFFHLVEPEIRNDQLARRVLIDIHKTVHLWLLCSELSIPSMSKAASIENSAGNETLP